MHKFGRDAWKVLEYWAAMGRWPGICQKGRPAPGKYNREYKNREYNMASMGPMGALYKSGTQVVSARVDLSRNTLF